MRPLTRTLAGAIVLALTACGTQATANDLSDGAATATPAASTTTDPSATATSTPTESTTATVVSANTASRDELVAALTGAGVANADRWAAEIEEYRPYETSDPTLQHLQDELAKYDPDAATLAAILSVLEP